MAKHYEIRLGGSGGQGMMLMGDIMANAGGRFEDYEIVLTKSYGPESRGGACRSELIFDEKPIGYPMVVAPNFVLALTQLACDQYHKDIAKDGILLIDPMFVKHIPESVKNVLQLPMTQIAVNLTGKSLVTNVVALGAIAVLGKFLKRDSLEKAVQEYFPETLKEMNQKAFQAGVEAAQKLL